MRRFLFVAIAFIIIVSTFGDVYAKDKGDEIYISAYYPKKELILKNLKKLYDRSVTMKEVLGSYKIPDAEFEYETFIAIIDSIGNDKIKKIKLKRLDTKSWILTDWDGDIAVVKDFKEKEEKDK